jgi:type IV secretory pathway VirD2 relaxase
MDQASRVLGTRLDWVAVDHWNTEHPHIHILVRGRGDDLGLSAATTSGELAEPAGPARWVLAADTEQRLRALAERGDIIKRLHKSLAKDGASRAPSSWALEANARVNR